MPELPEVETIRRDLLSQIQERIIREVVICPDPQGGRVLRRYPSPRRFVQRLKNRTITDIKRRAKYLLFYLDSEEILIIHLGMSGRLFLMPFPSPPPPYTRLLFRLSGKCQLCLVDPRKFGEAYLYSPKRGDDLVNPFHLGLEPLGKAFTPKKLAELLGRRHAAIKTVLLDQKAIAGLGNIYSDEALFRARIHPRRPSSSLKPIEIRRLYRAIRAVLQEAIKARGTTASDRQYLDSRGRAGTFQHRLNVYGKKGKRCRRCSGPIETERIGGRTAHFCPLCQK